MCVSRFGLPASQSVLTHLQRLTTDPPEVPCAPLSDFLESAAISCPKAFFKSIFTCAASMKDLTIANHLCALYALARFYPALWTHDPEMMSVALMTDPGASRAGSLLMSAVPEPAKGKARYGQMIIMVELIQHLRRVRQFKEPAVVSLITTPQGRWSWLTALAACSYGQVRRTLRNKARGIDRGQGTCRTLPQRQTTC